MNKIIATIIKEWQLMRRDVSGLLLLLVMPAALIIVMALIQDAPFKDYENLRFDLLVSDADHGSIAQQITAGLKQSRNFHIVDSLDGRSLTETDVMHLLSNGKYKMGIVIPDGVSAEIVNSTNIIVNDISQNIGLDAHLPTREMRGQVYIHLHFDPVSQPAFRAAIKSALDKYISYSCSNILMQRLSQLSKTPSANDTARRNDLRKIMQGISVRDEPINDNGRYMEHMTSVQHNVPAWAIFGMFFIVIPIAGHILKERQDGSALRVGLIPGVSYYVALGKIIFYTIICTLQFALMLCIGFWLMPLIGLPSLYPGAHAWLLLPVAICISFSATSFGFFIGTLFKTFTQALPFASVFVVILSAIGGIWIPVEVLPPTMQHIAVASPLYWSLDAVNQVIIRNGDLDAIIQPSLILLLSGATLCIASAILHNKMGRLIQ